jgi:hypothetical protein
MFPTVARDLVSSTSHFSVRTILMTRDNDGPAAAFRGIALAMTLLLLAGPVVGQGRSVLDLLDLGGRTMALGETRVGQLSEADWRSANGNYLQAWAIGLSAGETVYVELVSAAFDAYLHLAGPGLDDPLSDDDGAGACNARIVFTPAVEGTFRVVVSSLGSRSGGEFSLRVATEPGPEAPGSCGGGAGGGADPDLLAALDPGARRLGMDAEATGSLSEADRQPNGDLLQSWAFTGEAGTSVTFDLMSREFDTFLYLVGPDRAVETDDDGGGACNARITALLPASGQYRLVAGAFGPGTGRFTLRASSEVPPRMDGPCPGGTRGLEPETVFDLEVAGPAVGRGDTVSGVLSSTDTVVNDSRVQVWELTAEEGLALSIDLRSEAFDALLYLMSADGTVYQRDDDGGGACHSRVTMDPAGPGRYRIVVTSIGMGSGEYTLSVSERPGPVEDGACGDTDLLMGGSVPLEELDPEGRTIEVGATVTGQITGNDRYDASMMQAWEFTAAEGDSITVDLMSEAFDSYLYLLGPGLEAPLSDDDGGDGLHSRITTRIPATGTYRIVVSMLGQDIGFFTLQVTRNP